MSVFEVRTFTPAGVQDKILGDVDAEFTDDFGTNGYVKISVPHGSPSAGVLSHDVEVALFIEGKEIDNSRARVREHTGNESEGDDAPGEAYEEVWGGKTLWARLDEAVVYPELWPDTSKMFHSFSNATPGSILKTLINRAQARGAITEITHSSWSSATASDGQGWMQNTIGPISYDAGKTIRSAAENLQRLNTVEPRMVGRDLRLYNPEKNGIDRSYIVLRRGKQVTDTPFSESSDGVRNSLLVIGDEGTAFEVTDPSSVSAYGRRESVLSQGGTSDVGTLTVLGNASLARSSGTRGEYTCKVLIGAPGEQPFIDYTTGDWVSLDRGEGAPVKYRIRQISVTRDENVWWATLTLNDKFTELDLETAKKVEGIMGGAGSDTVEPARPPSEVDKSTPKAPTGVTVTGDTYLTASGLPLATASVDWLPPTENTDNTALDDLAGYETEILLSDALQWAAPTTINPARLDDAARVRFDRRGETAPGWLAGDNAASIRAADGKDWFFWADTIYGVADGAGKVTGTWRMPHSSITISDPLVNNDLTAYFGAPNLLSETVARCETTTGKWTGAGAVSPLTVSTWKRNGYGSIEMTRNGTGAMRGQTVEQVAAAPGERFQGLVYIDPASTAVARVEVLFYNGSNVPIGAADFASPDTRGRASVLTKAAPAGTVGARLHVYSGAGATGESVRWTQAMLSKTDHELATWRRPVASVVVKNVAPNPQMKTVSGTHIVARNLFTDPNFQILASTSIVRTNLWDDPKTTSSSGYAGSGAAVGTAATSTPVGNSALTCTLTATTGSVYKTRSDLAAGTYTLSFWVWVDSASGATSARARVGGAGVTNGESGAYSTAVNSWQRVSVTFDVAAGHNALPQVQALGAVNGVVYMAGILLEKAGVMLPYFDGTTPTDATTGWTYGWSGAANASSSYWYAPKVNSGTYPYDNNRGGQMGGNTFALYRIGPVGSGLIAFQGDASIAVSAGEFVAGQFEVRQVGGVGPVVLQPQIGEYAPSYVSHRTPFRAPVTVPANGAWQTVYMPSETAFANSSSARLMLYFDGTKFPEGSLIQIRRVRIDKVPAAGFAPLGDYFDGSSVAAGGLTYAWSGAANASASTATGSKPTYAQSNGTWHQVVIDGKTWMTTNSGTYLYGTGVGVVGKYYGARFTLRGTPGRQVGIGNTDNVVGGWCAIPTVTIPASGEIEVIARSTVPVGGVGLALGPAGSPSGVAGLLMTDLRIEEVSGPDQSPGPFFSGDTVGSQFAWDGVANQSSSSWTVTNTDHSATGPTSLLTSDDAGGPLDEYLWSNDAFVIGGQAYLFLDGQRATPEGGSWGFESSGNIYLAQIDVAAKRLVRMERWSNDSIRWGAAVRVDGSYVYIVGTKRLASGGEETHLVRVTTADPWGTRTYWAGGAWSSMINSVAVATTPLGFSSIRKMANGTWVALYSPFYASDLYMATAPDISGPWTTGTKIFKYPEPSGSTGDRTFKYVPRFVPQYDDNALGLSFLYCQNGDVLNNVLRYVPRFLRGPAGTKSAVSGTGLWRDRRSTTDAPALYSGLTPSTVVTARTRAVDNSGHRSAWTTSNPIVLPSDVTGPAKPSKPLVSSFFHGVRAEWNGRDVNGAAMPPDYLGFEVHVSENEDFVPTSLTRVDWMQTRGGITPIPDLDVSKAYWVRIVAYDNALNASEPSDAVSAVTEQLSDPDLPEKLINGAKHVQPGSISIANLTVAAFSDSLLRNGNFEEAGDPSINDGYPTGWRAGYWSGNPVPGQNQRTTNPAEVLSGGASMKMQVSSAASQAIVSDTIPVTPSSIYYVSFKGRTTRAVTWDRIVIRLWTSDTESKIFDFTYPGTTANYVFGPSVNANETVGYEVNFTIPNGHKFAALDIRFESMATGSYDVIVDDVEVRKIVGEAAIANASIGTAKIKLLAVDDARIASMNVGKLVAGILNADITVSARIKTADTGQRVEINANGVQAYNASGAQTVSISSTSGVHLLEGTIRTGSTGARVEIAPSGVSGGVARFYSAFATETAPGSVSTWVQGDAPASNAALYLVSPKRNTYAQCTLVLQSADSDGAAAAALYLDRGDLQVFSANTQTYQWGGIMFRNLPANNVWGQIMREGAGARFHSESGDIRVSSQFNTRVSSDTASVGIEAPLGTIHLTAPNTQHQGGPLRLKDTWARGISSAAAVGIGSDGTLYHITSSKRYKIDVKDATLTADAARMLRPRTFIDKREYTENGKKKDGLSRHLGLIAEEVAEIPGVGDLIVPRDEQGRPNEVRYDRVPLVMLPWLADLEERMRAIESRA